jgi:hypothetical protein
MSVMRAQNRSMEGLGAANPATGFFKGKALGIDKKIAA